MKRPGSCDRLLDREKVAVSPNGNTRYWGVFLAILVGLLVILVAFSLWLPPARTAEAQGTPALSIDPVSPTNGTAATMTLSNADSYPYIRYEVWNSGANQYEPLADDVNHTVVSGIGTTSLSFYHNANGNINTEYYRACYGSTEAACSSFTDFITVHWAIASGSTVDPPGAAGTPTLTVESDTSISATWTAGTNADGYKVQWSTTAGSFDTTNQATVTGTSHTITGLTASTTYYVRVISTRTGASDGTPSAESNATTSAALPAPGSVTNLANLFDSFNENGTVNAAFTWAAAANAGGYRVEWGTAPGSYTNSAAATETYIIVDLLPNTEYYIRVTATRSGAPDGTPSDELAYTTPYLPSPDQAAGVSASADDHDRIAVSWNAATNADGYRVEWGTTPGTYPNSATATDTSYTITGLAASTTYYVRVVSTRTDALDGTPSAEASAMTDALPTLAQVPGLTATADDHDRITVSWGPVADADGYVVEWDDESTFAGASQAIISSGSTVTYQLTGLQEDTAYYVRVKATRTGAPDGPVSAAATATTALQPPERVTGVMAAAVSDVEIMVSWRMAIRADAYVVQWRGDGQAFDSSRQASVRALMYDAAGLAANTRYHFRVIATRTGASDGTPSAEASATTDAALTPGPVTGVSATVVSDRELQATWAAATNATGYLVQWDTDDTFPDPDEARTSGTGVVIERLMAETEYHVRVKGTRNGATDGAYSTSASATTGDAQIKVWAERFPGGAIAGQLVLTVFAGVMAGVRFKSMKSPRREAVITGAMSVGALILPAFGQANEFWVIGVALLVLLASIAAIFLARR